MGAPYFICGGADIPFDVDAALRYLGSPDGRWTVVFLSTVDSTNRYLRDAHDLRRVNRTAVVSDYQTAGRGRLGRSWSAPRGTSLLVSIQLDWTVVVPESHGTMLASLSVVDALKSVGIDGICLKWPNDVLVRGRKICGILAEIMAPARQLLIGVGLNVNFDAANAAGLPPNATSVQTEIGHQVNREPLLAAYLLAIDAWLARLSSDRSVVFDEWRRNLVTIGRLVEVREDRLTWQGTAVDAEWDGALVVRSPSGAYRQVYAGDVSIRDANFTQP